MALELRPRVAGLVARIRSGVEELYAWDKGLGDEDAVQLALELRGRVRRWDSESVFVCASDLWPQHIVDMHAVTETPPCPSVCA